MLPFNAGYYQSGVASSTYVQFEMELEGSDGNPSTLTSPTASVYAVGSTSAQANASVSFTQIGSTKSYLVTVVTTSTGLTAGNYTVRSTGGTVATGGLNFTDRPLAQFTVTATGTQSVNATAINAVSTGPVVAIASMLGNPATEPTFTVTGITSPAAANGTYYLAGVYNTYPYYQNPNGYYLYVYSGALLLSASLTNSPTNYFGGSGVSPTISQTLSANGSWTGTATISSPAVTQPGMFVGTVATSPTDGGHFSLTGLSPALNASGVYTNMWLLFTSGANYGIPRIVTTLNTSTGAATFTGSTTMSGAFPITPSAGDSFILFAGAE